MKTKNEKRTSLTNEERAYLRANRTELGKAFTDFAIEHGSMIDFGINGFHAFVKEVFAAEIA